MLNTMPQVLLTALIEKKSGIIIGPISTVLGFLINILYNFVSWLRGTEAQVLGISIILFTILIRCLMIPLNLKSQKSQEKMTALQPQIKKIQDKYGDTKDPELQNKMNAEIQTLYSKNNVNMFSGCLPMLLTLPIFFALNYMMRQTYLYVSNIGEIYEQIALLIQQIPNYAERGSAFFDMCVPMVPNGMTVSLYNTDDLMRFINKFTSENWQTIFSLIEDPTLLANITEAYDMKMAVESFFGLNLIESAGTSWPGIMIPIISGLTSFLTQWQLTRSQTSADPSTKSTQTVMMIVMPLMMGWITISVSTGVGIYWITGNVFMLVQQFVFQRRRAAKLKEAS